MAIELQVPDLPALTLGTERAVSRVRQPWSWRIREALAAYLPLLLMLLLALATWWLVQNTPVLEPPREAAPPRHEPDYTMQRFTLQRFGPDGRLRVQVEGEQLRHYPDTDTVEVDTVRIRALAADGSVTLATAKRAITNGDASEVQLLGGAHVTSDAESGSRAESIEFRGEFLHAFLATEKIRSHLPVTVRRGANEMHANGMEYDHLSRTLHLKGKVRAVFAPVQKKG